MTTDTSGLSQLGAHTAQPTSPETAALAERMRLCLDAFDLKALASLAEAGGQP